MVHRYICSTAQNLAGVTAASLLDADLVAVTAVLGYEVWDAFRIKSVEMWTASNNGSPSVPTQVAIEWGGIAATGVSSGRIDSDISMGVATAHVKSRPPKGSAASFWQVRSTTALFYISIPVGGIIDVTMEVVQDVLTTPIAAQNALVGAVTGNFYSRGLDGLAAATTTLASLWPNPI